MKFILALSLLAVSVLARPQQQEDEFFDPNPQYTFSYKVASDETQTYMNQEESRDGDFVKGEYSYVDPNGNLITVAYTAGPEGYSETRSIQEGIITINPVKPVSNVPSGTQSRPSGIDENQIINQIVGGLAPVIEQSVALGLDNVK